MLDSRNDDHAANAFWDEEPIRPSVRMADTDADDTGFDDESRQSADFADDQPDDDDYSRARMTPEETDDWPTAEQIEDALTAEEQASALAQAEAEEIAAGQSEALAPEQPEAPDDDYAETDGDIADTGDDDGQLDLDSVLAEVDQALADAERPVDLTPEQMEKGDVIAATTAVFELMVRGKGFSRAVNPESIVTDQFKPAAEAKMLRASKKGIVCPELDELGKVVKAFKKSLRFIECPTDLLRDGMRLIPLANVDRVEDLWRGFVPEYKARLRAFLAVYVVQQQRAQALQGPLFNPRHYPALQDVAKGFGVSRRWLAFNAPEATEEIKAVAFRQANAAIRAQVAEAGVEMVANLRAEAADYIQWFATQLQTGEDGKRKSISESKFQNMIKFFEMAGALNVTGDAEFNNAIEMGKAALAGHSLDDFKASGKQRISADQLRQQTAQALGVIQEATAEWVVDAPSRMMMRRDEV